MLGVPLVALALAGCGSASSSSSSSSVSSSAPAVASATTAAATTAAPATSAFLAPLKTVSTVASTVPANGDVNPYGIVVVPTSTGKGYWMVGKDGGVFAFGDAGFVGSLPGIGIHVNNIVAVVPT